jgi:hypothetical protein
VVSVQIIDKSRGHYKLIKTIGSSSSTEDIERLYQEGLLFIAHYGGQTSLQDIFDEDIETVLHRASDKQHLKYTDKRGYNKFLEISDDVKVSINQKKITKETLEMRPIFHFNALQINRP